MFENMRLGLDRNLPSSSNPEHFYLPPSLPHQWFTEESILPAMNTKLVVIFLALAAIGGCSSDAARNVAGDASQSEIDQYNQLIQEEAERVKAAPEEKVI